jgi:hypothetical protein
MSAVKPVESEPAKNAYGYGTAHANGATRTFTPPIDEGEKKQPFFGGGHRCHRERAGAGGSDGSGPGEGK